MRILNIYAEPHARQVQTYCAIQEHEKKRGTRRTKRRQIFYVYLIGNMRQLLLFMSSITRVNHQVYTEKIFFLFLTEEFPQIKFISRSPYHYKKLSTNFRSGPTVAQTNKWIDQFIPEQEEEVSHTECPKSKTRTYQQLKNFQTF